MQLITPPHPQLPLHFFSNNLKSILGKDLQYLFIKSFQAWILDFHVNSENSKN